jgi:hypothetical protein
VALASDNRPEKSLDLELPAEVCEERVRLLEQVGVARTDRTKQYTTLTVGQP